MTNVLQNDMAKYNLTEKLNTNNHIIGDAFPLEACHVVGKVGDLLGGQGEGVSIVHCPSLLTNLVFIGARRSLRTHSSFDF